MIRIGCAGWSLPRAAHDRFPEGEASLARYSAVFSCAEINSSFHRPHRASTYERWAASVPPGFRFSVKLAKTITHGARLVKATALLDDFLAPVRALGDAFGCLLVQLPPKLELDAAVAKRFFAALEKRGVPLVALEPRNASWFTPAADALLAERGIARVAADPSRVPGGDEPGGARGFAYYRLHGAPRMYYSAYDDAYLEALARRIAGHGMPSWVVFDNTAGNAAVFNALDLREKLQRGA
ncbi:MAG TPA: DUF72 domain-containing protein [Usitatibacter sp.]|nr:DUF72 domain-containing protein [Usitatibacter sp.]